MDGGGKPRVTSLGSSGPVSTKYQSQENRICSWQEQDQSLPDWSQDQSNSSCRTAFGPQSRDQRAARLPAATCGHSQWLQMPLQHTGKWRNHSCHLGHENEWYTPQSLQKQRTSASAPTESCGQVFSQWRPPFSLLLHAPSAVLSAFGNGHLNGKSCTAASGHFSCKGTQRETGFWNWMMKMRRRKKRKRRDLCLPPCDWLDIMEAVQIFCLSLGQYVVTTTCVQCPQRSEQNTGYPWNWGYRQSQVIVWVLGLKLYSEWYHNIASTTFLNPFPSGLHY